MSIIRTVTVSVDEHDNAIAASEGSDALMATTICQALAYEQRGERIQGRVLRGNLPVWGLMPSQQATIVDEMSDLTLGRPSNPKKGPLGPIATEVPTSDGCSNSKAAEIMNVSVPCGTQLHSPEMHHKPVDPCGLSRRMSQVFPAPLSKKDIVP